MTALQGLAAAVLLLEAGRALAAGSNAWPDSFVGRLEALALIESLNADLLSHDSATLTLERWCADHRLADPPRISSMVSGCMPSPISTRAPTPRMPIESAGNCCCSFSPGLPRAPRGVSLAQTRSSPARTRRCGVLPTVPTLRAGPLCAGK